MLQMPTALGQCYAFFRQRRTAVLLACLLVVASIAAIRLDFHCDCEHGDHGNGGGGWGMWVTAELLAQCQKVSDLLIATAYFSIPLELVYFACCSRDFPSSFKRVLFQFGAFIVPCGLTHLLAALAIQHAPNHPPPTLSLTLAGSKLLTAVVSLATAVSQLTLLPQLLRAKTREDLLRRKALELGLEVGVLRRREQAGWDVGILVREIRNTLDRRAVLNATVAELTKALDLRNCAVWMPVDRGDGEVSLTIVQETLNRRKDRGFDRNLCVPVDDPEVADISASAGAKLLAPGSRLARLSSGGGVVPEAAAAAFRVMLHGTSGSDSIAETPEQNRAVRCGIVVCVLHLHEDEDGVDSVDHELEVLELVTDEVAVALSQASALEEVQLERVRLAEQNAAIERERARAEAADAAGASLLTALLREMRGPARSTASLVEALAWEPELREEQKIAVDALSKVGVVVASLVDGFGAEHIKPGGSGFFALETHPFRLRSMIKAATGIAKVLCMIRHVQIGVNADGDLPDLAVVGDEKRVVQVIMHVLDGLLDGPDEGGQVTFRVRSDWDVEGPPERRWAPWKMTSFPDGHVNVEFKIGIKRYGSRASSSSSWQVDWASEGDGMGSMDSTFRKCRKLIQMMQGNMWVIPDSQGCSKTAILLIPFPLLRQTPDRPSHPPPSSASYDGLRVLLLDGDSVSRATTRILLERLGCRVFSASSDSQCLSQLDGSRPPPFDVVILDVDVADVDVFEVSTQIHKFQSAPWPMVLALVGDEREGAWERCLQAGMVGMIKKPVTRRGITDELRRVLRMT